MNEQLTIAQIARVSHHQGVITRYHIIMHSIVINASHRAHVDGI